MHRLSLSIALLALGATTAALSDSRHIGVEAPGVYAVSFAEAMLEAPVASKSLSLTHRDGQVPMLVEDGDDGEYGPGDRLLFVADHLAGERSYFNEYSRHNVYRLVVGEGKGTFYRQKRARSGKPGAVQVIRHLERDKLRVRFRPGNAASPEPWYWERLSHITREPFSWEFDLEGADVDSLQIRVGMRGWSQQRRKAADGATDHRIEAFLNDEPVGVLEYDGQDEAVMALESMPEHAVNPGKNTLTLVIPKRTPEGAEHAIVDVQLLNWIELEHTFTGISEDRQVRIAAADRQSALRVPANTRLFGPGRVVRVTEQDQWARLTRSGSWDVVSGDAYMRPAFVRIDRPSTLKQAENRADYLLISHPTLAEAASALAEHHREQGLRVMEVDVIDVYDEFNHGIQSPLAIRDFLSHAYHSWEEGPRFVLLVGDASWDIHNDEAKDEYYADWTYRPGETRRFIKNASTQYAAGMERNLIPAFSVETYEGHAASDNAFVAVAGDDFAPDMAIGRLPVVRPDEVTAIVDKLIRYAEEADVGPWRRNVLWITNEQLGFQRATDQLAEKYEANGLRPIKVYPQPDERDNQAHQELLKSSFDEGQLLVHFLGHGGRYIWRTGPPDIRKNHDLFTLDDVDDLEPSNRLPLILSMTCYSAPFDHPTADSIGEKFLRLADRGAVGVFAASWRNSPSRRFSDRLIEALTQQGSTIGEAIMTAKSEERSRIMVETYNLLGDPAARLALPQLPVSLEAQMTDEGWSVAGGVPGLASGEVIADWMDNDGNIVLTSSGPLEQSGFHLVAARSGDAAPRKVRVYVWNKEARLDGMASLSLPVNDAQPEKVSP